MAGEAPETALLALADVANGTLAGEEACEALSAALEAVAQLKRQGGWASLLGSEVSAAAVARQLGDVLKEYTGGLGVRAAAVYASLLSLQDAPVSTVCH
jgi:hypothetical protein